MKLKVKRLSDKAVIPTRAHVDDVGFDLTAISEKIVNLKDYGYVEYDTGIAVTPEKGYYCKIAPRSSISKTGLILANSPSTIDPGYTGTITLRFKWIPDTLKYNVGDRIGQLIVLPMPEVEIEEVEELQETSRAAGAYGSTGA